MPIKKSSRGLALRAITAAGDSVRFEYTAVRRSRLVGVVVSVVPVAVWDTGTGPNRQLGFTTAFVYRGPAGDGSGNALGSAGFPGSVDVTGSIGELLAAGSIPMAFQGPPSRLSCEAIIEAAEVFTVEVPRAFDAAQANFELVVTAYPILQDISGGDTQNYRAI